MTRARQTDAWDRTSHVLCMLYSVNRGKGAPPRKPRDFHPYPPEETKTRASRQPASPEDLAALKRLFARQLKQAAGAANTPPPT